MGDCQITLYYVKFSLHAVASAVSLNCTPQTYVCDGEEVVCNCTAPCSETIHWWDNRTISFCSRTQLCNGNRENCVPDISGSPPVRVEVINCSSTDIFTSRLSYNASLSTSRSIQIGCSSSRISRTTCSPEEPLDSESVTLPVRNCTGTKYVDRFIDNYIYVCRYNVKFQSRVLSELQCQS